MFSKPIKTPSGTGPFSSITGTLIFLYTTASAVILTLCAMILYWEFTQQIHSEYRLSDIVDEVKAILRDHPDNLELLSYEIESDTTLQGNHLHYVRILDENGRLIVETAGMNALFTSDIFSPPPEGSGDSIQSVEGVLMPSRHGREYLLNSSWAPIGKSGTGQRLVQVAVDINHEKALLGRYRNVLLLMILIGVGVSAGAGVVVTRKGLHPLKAMTQATHRITANQLQDRIGQENWPQELKTLAASFDAMLSRLESSFTRLSQFSTDLAHELRTPLNNLRGETEVSLTKLRTPAVYNELLISHMEEYERLSLMIDSLLLLARMDNPEDQIERSVLDARKEIEKVKEFYHPLAEEKEIEVTCQGEASLKADPTLFQRAVSNVLSNSLKYTPHKGKTHIAIQRLADHGVEVSISDTGYGIPPEHLPRVCGRFYRINHPKNNYQKGMGLGLALVKSIMDLHRGEIKIESELAMGTTVTLRFPALG